MSNQHHPGNSSHLQDISNAALGIVLSSVLIFIVTFIPSSSLDELHLDAVRAANQIAPDIKCNHSVTSGQVKNSSSLKLLPEVIPPFLSIVSQLNILADHLSSSDGSALFYRCVLPAAPPALTQARFLTRPEEITYAVAQAVNSIDKILSIYLNDPNLPITHAQNLQVIRDSVLKIAYDAGDLIKLQSLTAFADIIVVFASFGYMFVTFLVFQPVLLRRPYYDTFIIVLSILTSLATLYLATSDWFTALYALLPLMVLSALYTRRSQTVSLNETKQGGRLRSILALFRWGSILYAVFILLLLSLYMQGGYSVGSYPLQIFAKLNVANAFFTITLSAFAIWGFRRRKFLSTWRKSLPWIALVLGPIFFVAALVNYGGWIGDPGYPGNLLYRLLTLGDGSYRHPVVPPLIEIVTARLMISIPLAIIIVNRLVARIQDREKIATFLRTEGDESDQELEFGIGPGVIVRVRNDGVLWPNQSLSHPASAQLLPEEKQTAPSNSSDESEPSQQRKISTNPRVFFSHLIGIISASRPINVVMAVILAEISYAIASAPNLDIVLQIILAISTALAVGGSFIINDVADIRIDRINKPHRAIASGRLPVSLATSIGIGALFCAATISFTISPSLGLFWSAICCLSLFYTFILKPRMGLLANVLSAAMTTGICFVGCFTSGKYIDMFGISVAVFLACMAREIAKDIEDCNADRGQRKATLVMLVGHDRAMRVAVSLAVFQVVFSYLPYSLGTFGSAYFFAISAANALFGLSLLAPLSLRHNGSRMFHERVKFSMGYYLLAYIVGMEFLTAA